MLSVMGVHIRNVDREEFLDVIYRVTSCSMQKPILNQVSFFCLAES